ncbi:MAG: hypothetical protein ACKVQV_09555 [Bacteroidia bacterium]
MTQDKIERIKNILTVWNPARDALIPIVDLNNYDTEVEDFIFNLEIEYDFPEEKITNKQAIRMLKEVLNEAFNLHLTDAECEKPTLEIMKILNAD